MGTNSKIEWTDHTWNPWYGCPDDGRRSPACDNCYARAWAKRSGLVDFDREIMRASDKTFYAPMNREKYRPGDKVFVCSLSDVFHPLVSNQEFVDMMRVVSERPDLIFIFLTKRIPGVGDGWHVGRFHPGSQPPQNIWLGVTAENQEQADKRIPYLLSIPAAVRFVSCEPLLGPVNIEPYLLSDYDKAAHDNQMTGNENRRNKLDWVICGGESGPGARPMHPDWARGLRDQCATTNTPFLFKQHGEWREAFDRWVKYEATKTDLARIVLVEPDGRTTPTICAGDALP